MVRLALTLALLCSAAAAQAEAPTLVSIQTPRGAKQAFILMKPDKPVAAVILFAGGHGALGLKSASSMARDPELPRFAVSSALRRKGRQGCTAPPTTAGMSGDQV